jgi:anti-anti-sigma factor
VSEIEIVRLPNRFDYANHRNFTETSMKAIDAAGVNEIILDFSIVEYLDSSALGMMVLFQKKALDKKIKVKIRGAKGATNDILTMANMQKLFEFIQ